MRRKLDLAMTLMGQPAVVFLDEPTTGLDPRSRRTLWDEVRALVTAGTTVLLTTQYLDEADHLADRVAVLDGGRIVAEGTPADLKQAHDAGSLDDVFLRLTDPARSAGDPARGAEGTARTDEEVAR
jgi:ABC-2 type transport system ATP-binding protein